MNNSPNAVSSSYDDWAARTPIVTRAILIASGIGIILSLLGLDLLFANCPYSIIFKFQIYRLLLAPLVSFSAISGLFGLYMIITYIQPVEEQKGSMYVFVLTCCCSLVIQLFFLSILPVIVLIFNIPTVKSPCAAGFWPIIFVFLVIEAMSSGPDPNATRKLLCLPIEIPAKYYPLALLLIFSLMGGLRLDTVIGAAIGYALAIYPWLFPSTHMLNDWSSSRYLAWLVNAQGYKDPQLLPLSSDPASSSSSIPSNIVTVSSTNQNASSTVIAAKNAGPSDWRSGKGHRLDDPSKTVSQQVGYKLGDHIQDDGMFNSWALHQCNGNDSQASLIVEWHSSMIAQGFQDADLKWALEVSHMNLDLATTHVNLLHTQATELIELGFSEIDAFHALRYAENDLNKALSFMRGE